MTIDEQWASELYHNVVSPNVMDINMAAHLGMIPKAKLEHLHVYGGYCRNASVAVWDAEDELFTYVREKWGFTFIETIPHPENDKGFDVFVPTVEILMETA